jgi:hypothetical protein
VCSATLCHQCTSSFCNFLSSCAIDSLNPNDHHSQNSQNSPRVFSITVSLARLQRWFAIYLFYLFMHFYTAPSSPLLLRGGPDYSPKECWSFHAKVPRATVSEGLAQGPCAVARVWIKPATLPAQGIDYPITPHMPHVPDVKSPSVGRHLVRTRYLANTVLWRLAVTRRAPNVANWAGNIGVLLLSLKTLLIFISLFWYVYYYL